MSDKLWWNSAMHKYAFGLTKSTFIIQLTLILNTNLNASTKHLIRRLKMYQTFVDRLFISNVFEFIRMKSTNLNLFSSS